MENFIENFNSATDTELIDLVVEGNSEAFKELSDRHSGICMDTYKKYTNFPNFPQHVSDDMRSSKDFVIFNSAKSFDPSKGAKFSTWLANQVRFFCLNSLTRESKNISSEIDVETTMLPEPKTSFEERSRRQKSFFDENSEKIKELLKNLKNKNIKECIEKKYFNKSDKVKTFTEVAAEMGVTVQTAINWHSKFIKLAKFSLKKT
jgi:DNA-directed RNA polymerase specialized sigma subunit